MNQELIDYIKKAKESGQSDEQIKQALLAAGWEKNDILDAIKNSRLSEVKNISWRYNLFLRIVGTILVLITVA